jgi:large subunit ribosomal protein L9
MKTDAAGPATAAPWLRRRVEDVMKVILRTDIINVGKQGDIKEVSAGYARNYLLPKALVMEATPSNLKTWEKEKKRLEQQRGEIVTKAREMAEKIARTPITLQARAGTAGRLFGSVTNVAIARALGENGFLVDKHDIVLPDPIREAGVYTIDIRLQPEVTAQAKITVVVEGAKEKEKEKEQEPEPQEQAAPAAEQPAPAEPQEPESK